MYQNGAILAAFLLIYSAVAGRIERSWISGPIVFVAVGFILGPDALGVFRLNITGEGLRVLAELTLAMVLFTDAANADFDVLRRNQGPSGPAALGRSAADDRARFCARRDRVPVTRDIGDRLTGSNAGADGCGARQASRDNQAVPAVMREALNVESDLNDGICVPIVVLLIGLAIGTQI